MKASMLSMTRRGPNLKVRAGSWAAPYEHGPEPAARGTRSSPGRRYQYQLSDCSWAHAPQGEPYRPWM
jgi:hypothetical protein